MQETTLEDRKKELRELLQKLTDHPDGAFPKERARVSVLQSMLAAHEHAKT